MNVDLIHLFQIISWFLFTVLCAVFGYAATRWISSTYFPERFITLNRYHNNKLISSHKIDLQSAEPLVQQFREAQKDVNSGR